MGDIVNNNLFIPVLILACAAIISIVVLVVFSKKKKNKKINSTAMLSLDIPKTEIEQRIETEATAPVNESNSILPTVPMVNEMENSVLPSVSVKEEIKTPILPEVPTAEEVKVEVPVTPVVEQEEPIKVVEVKKEEPMGPPPKIDIPVPTIDDTPITVEEAKSLVDEDYKDSIEVEKYEAVNEEVSQDEIINVNEAKQLIEDNQESITVEEAKSLANDVGESVSIEEVKPAANDVGETAFKSIPNGDMYINTDIKAEPVKEVSNKTEIFNLEDIKQALIQEDSKRDLL